MRLLNRFAFVAVICLIFSFSANRAHAQCTVGTELAPVCGDLTQVGCCGGTQVLFCDPITNVLCSIECADNWILSDNVYCGWDTTLSAYNCTPQIGPQDPSGVHPLSCGVSTEPDCGNIGYQGCCTTAGQMKYCDNGTLHIFDCPNNSNTDYQLCGWDAANGYYDCGTSTAPDPSGSYPYLCGDGGTCTANCAGKECGDDGCGGVCGNCPGSLSCVAGQCVPNCSPDCFGKTCGGDGCGGVCGYCGPSQSCEFGQCVQGCVSDCSGFECGDDGCGGSCGTCPTAMTCQAGLCVGGCSPQCFGKDCGPDGCGGSCGTCNFDEVCNYVVGQCESSCEPSCLFSECGDDGCGGTCGECLPGDECLFGLCIPGNPGCTADCFGKDCGDDGCGGSCGTCAFGQTCNTAGQCDGNACTPSCAGKNCGPDGCGSTCGSCSFGETCEAGVCTPGGATCTPSCENKECGDDGCGGSCGYCGAKFDCSADFVCVPCESQCDGRECGDDGCGDVCGYCEMGSECSDFGFCIEEGCQPYCAGKNCGDDGCGGQCGVCSGGAVCADGTCSGGTTPTPGNDAGSTPQMDTGNWENPCPEGQVLLYGNCVVPSENQPGIDEVRGSGTGTSSGCSGSTGNGNPFITLIFAGLLVMWRRREAERGWLS